ncbi:1-(5-phosphoribosyl)-5-[(5-phosphoribosylamino)methylideneamino]imidazole-4-carboxamide isomerase [Clostridium sp. WILCCON 0269]|uniref:1-(5-phosphoribosyl)-5-[(5-phosphoribosylamino)methylideneamino] imidazole-4-carboxamide isomerase n=1 Tax=Candidatus Clostridium eludens TaxID=3381663 RepID=A0ABW8SLD6_9CLOT
MLILPAIDLKGGKCVRLYQGDMNSQEIVAKDPLDTALKFKSEGAEYIHIVDLDGALKGAGENLSIISNIVKNVDVPIEVGGGIRSIEIIDSFIKLGVSRVILGTAALNNRNLVIDAVRNYGEKIAVGIDAKDGIPAVDGWTTLSEINYIDFGKQMEQIGVKTLIFTDISRDGTLKGTNVEQLLELKNSVKCNVIASGGIKDIEDIKKLKAEDVYGAIVGKAIYSKTLSLKEAIEVGGN